MKEDKTGSENLGPMSSSPDRKMAPLSLEIYGETGNVTSIFYLFITAILFSLVAGIFISLTTNNAIAAKIIAISIFPVVGALFLIRRKKFEGAAIFLTLTLLSILTLLATYGLGIHQISNLGFPAILIIASLVTKRRTMILLTIYTIGCLAWLVFGELAGVFKPLVLVKSVPGDFFSASLVILFTAYMVRFLAKNVFQSNARLQTELKERKIAEEKYRKIFENAIEGMFQSTPDGHFINVNPAMARMYGYNSPEEMVQKVTNISDQLYLEPELRKDLRHRLAFGQQITGFESQDYRMDGSTFWTSTNIQAILDSTGNILYYEGTVEDITSRKMTDEILRESEERFRTLFNRILDGIYRSSHHGRFLDVNPAMIKMFGYNSKEEMLAVDIKKELYFAPEERESLFLDTGQEKVDEFRMRRKDGSEIWVEDHGHYVHDNNGNVIYHEGILRDITERKKAEAELQNNQQRLQAFFNQSLDGFFFSMFEKPREWNDSVDKEKVLEDIFMHQRYTDVNNAMLEQYGTTREKFLNRTSSDFFAHDPEQGRQLRRQLFDKGHMHLETYEHKDDGTPVWFEGDYVCIYDEQRRITGFFGIQRDITDRKHAEEALRWSEERFRKVFHSSPIAICITTLNDGRLLDANQAYWNITGYLPEASIGRNADELKMWNDPQERREFVKEIKQKQSIANLNYRFFHKNGSLKQVMSFYERIQIGDEDCILAMFYDMSTQKQLELEREDLIHQLEIKNAESETLHESLSSIVGTFEFSRIITNILDQIKRVIPYDSASVWKVEGNLQKFITGRDLPPLFSNDSVEVEFSTDKENSALPILKGEVPYILNNNVQEELVDFKQEPHTYVNSWLAIPLKTRGKIIGLIALDGKTKGQFNEHHAELAVVFANQVAIALENANLFTELQNELSMREKLIQELESKNAELEQFTYTVSHDLKSPLVTINGFLGYLEGDASSGNMNRIRIDIQRIQEAVNKMHLLLKELLELSRVGRLISPPEAVPFEDLVHEALDLVHGQIEARKVTVFIHPNLPTVYGDRQRLIEVLQNLIDNSTKYMGDQPNPRIEIGQRGEEFDRYIFFVKDNGIGISPEYHNRIFGLFDKLDPRSDGTGVGLALVKRIVEVHGGRIWVESERDNGATILFSVPKDKEE